MTWRIGVLTSLGLLAATGCGPQVELTTAETGNGSDTGTDATGEDTVDTIPEVDSSTGGPQPTARQADIIFVIDNSGSMGEEQIKVATAIGNLVGVLDNAVPPVDYRIAVTTTDNGNPWCQGTTPEAGLLRATSCRERAEDFTFQGATTLEYFEPACGDLCVLETLDLPDPWIEVQNSIDETNVPGGVVIDALRCMLPQGINGCGFEQQLESMYKAILRTETEGEASFGFRREGALLAVALITDEADCSYNVDHETIFLPDGDRVFWSDPTAPAPTSAVCWNAGVVCSGAGTPYDECHPENLDESGNIAGNDPSADAVLHPIIRYTSQLAQRGAYVVAIDGVSSGGAAVYATGNDPQFLGDFGIGPGCETADGKAVPPVRIRDVIATVSDPGSQTSICDSGYQDAFNAFGNGIVARLP